MKENKEENIDKIKIFSSDDEKLKILGELLSNKSSRDIIKLLNENEMYTNEIAVKLDLRTNLVIHHLKKLEELGLLEIRNKRISKKGNEHRFFKMIPNFIVTSNHTKKETEEKGFLSKIFKDGIKFVSIGIGGIVSFFISNALQHNNKWSNTYQSEADGFLISTIVGMIVVVAGLLVYIKFKK